jgi:hypothetical protein
MYIRLCLKIFFFEDFRDFTNIFCNLSKKIYFYGTTFNCFFVLTTHIIATHFLIH